MIDLEFLKAVMDHFMIMMLLFICFTIISNWTHRNTETLTIRAITGFIFGLFACAGMLLPVTIIEGVIIDARGPIISMAGIFLGPIGAIMAAVPAAILRIALGGTGTTAGMINILIPMALSGALGHYVRTHNGGIIPVKWIIIYAAITTPLCLGSLLMLPQNAANLIIYEAWYYLGAINMLGALILGYMLSQDQNRRIMARDLMNFRQKAEKADTAKSIFMARMSHELRTPMNSIIGFSDLLRSTDVNDEQRYFLEQIKVAGRTMTLLISNLLDFARIESGKVKLSNSPLNLVKLIESCGALIKPEADNKKLTLRTDIDPQCPEWVEGDELRLRQILMNLLSNAVKFTDAGHIWLKAVVQSQEGRQYTIAIYIEDSGIGIPANKQITIFNAFEQVDASMTREHGGSGLGLSIAQQLTAMMGGNIRLKSIEEQGSSFCVTLPFKSAEAAISNDRQPTIVAENIDGKTVLIVEDIAMNRDLVGSMLKKLGYNFETAENGEEALKLLKIKKFDMVLMDLQMPVLNGYDTTLAIREVLNIDNDTMPIIALTAHALPEEIAKCFESGMDDFLTKPVEFIELASKAEEWLDGGSDSWDMVEHDGSTYENTLLLSEADIKSFIGFVGVERLHEAYEEFINDNAARFLAIHARENVDDLIRTTLHNMAGASGNLGMKKLSLYAQHILNQGIEREHVAEDAEIDLLDNIFRESCRAFEKYIKSEA